MSGSIIGTVRCVECGQKLSYSATPGEIAVTPCKVCVGTAKHDAGKQAPSSPKEFWELTRRLNAQAWHWMLQSPVEAWLDNDDGPNKASQGAIEEAMKLVRQCGEQYKIEPAPTGAAPLGGRVEFYRAGWFVNERLWFDESTDWIEHEVFLLPKKGTHWRLRRFEERDGGK